MLFLHGDYDPLVPVEAAKEHARLVPQSELMVYSGSHFTVFTSPEMIAGQIIPFLAAVEYGSATTRSTAAADRIAQSVLPMDRTRRSRLLPLTAILLFLGLAISTLVNEDLACIAPGLMVSDGRAGFLLVTLANLRRRHDVAFLLGKFAGQKALGARPLQPDGNRDDICGRESLRACRGAKRDPPPHRGSNRLSPIEIRWLKYFSFAAA